MNIFHTPEFTGCWISLLKESVKESAHRPLAHRALIEQVLQTQLEDPLGKLIVKGDGPHWEGKANLAGLSYSHTGDWVFLAFSKTHVIGVDIEKTSRSLQNDFQKMAKRFFTEAEAASCKSPDQFLNLFMKKEAYAKATRLGLVKVLPVELSEVKDFRWIASPQAPVGLASTICLMITSG